MTTTDTSRPPADLFRAVGLGAGLELRDDSADGMPTLALRFAVFDEWTEINSLWEGRFLERLSPKSMNRTFREERDGMRVLFQHGRDPQVGDKPLGPIDALKAERDGAYSDVPMLDTAYNRELLPGLRAGLYGASFRFQVREENWKDKPGVSDYNPEGLPERTVLDMSVREFGPVTFPAYMGATAGVRSLTDLFRPASDDKNFTGRPAAERGGGGEQNGREPGNGGPASPSQQARHTHAVSRWLAATRKDQT